MNKIKDISGNNFIQNVDEVTYPPRKKMSPDELIQEEQKNTFYDLWKVLKDPCLQLFVGVQKPLDSLAVNMAQARQPHLRVLKLKPMNDFICPFFTHLNKYHFMSTGKKHGYIMSFIKPPPLY